ncbi:g3391 [Coccomyxa elongata]
MSLESLGSLARTVSDRFLRENLRRIIAGTNTSISSVLDGFRSQGSESAGKDWADPLQHGEPQPGPSAFEDFARGGSYARQSSDTMLKRRNSSIGRRAPGQQPQRELHTIYSATSLRAPISPRAQKKPQHRQQPLGQQRSSWRWSRILTAAVFIAWAILGVCFLIGTWLPHHSADLAQGVQPPAASWRLLSMLGTSNPRHLLEEGSGAPLHVETAQHRHGEDAFSAATKRVQHQEHASRWGQHMAGRMSRSLAEGDTTAATAEAPGIAATRFASARASSTGQSSSNSNGAAGEKSAAERAAAAGAGSGGGSGASVGDAAFGGVSLLQQDASADNNVQNTAAGGGANTLQYSNGYVNVTGPYYRMVEHTQNHGVCAAACATDAPCTAWTRVAAGRPDVQACYLASLSAADGRAFFTTAVQYVAPSPGGPASQVVLESGTKSPDALPAALYGCPYPPSRNVGCRPPPTCNCYQGVCYGDC